MGKKIAPEVAAQSLGAQLGVKAAGATPPGELPRVGQVEALRVVSVWSSKRLLVNREQSGLQVICQCKKTEHFMPGMLIPAARLGEGGIWYFTGKLPRRKGVW